MATKKGLSEVSASVSNNKAVTAFEPLLEALETPSISACSEAANIIAELVYDQPCRKKISSNDMLRFLLSVKLSCCHLRGYATLNPHLISQITSFISTISAYVNDESQQRPLNFLMLASPGAGKSHFIKCVASQLKHHNVSAITYNMASMQNNSDLIPPLDAVRNLKVEDRLPLLFLDEVDSSQRNFALLLPLLWDGGINLGKRDLKLGKVIIVMAGSDPSLPKTMDHARSLQQNILNKTDQSTKLIDLFSRINGGVLKIPSFYDSSQNIDRRADKVCIAIILLRQRFGSKLQVVPRALLRFVATVDFRYDVRSIAHLVDIIPYRKNTVELKLKHLMLPLSSAEMLKESSLAYHLIHEDQARGIVKYWEQTKRLIHQWLSIQIGLKFWSQCHRLI